MSTVIKQTYLSPQAYLSLERQADHKSEYHDGQMFAMAGASLAHNSIVSNMIISLGTQLKGKPYRVFPSDLKLKVQQTGLYTYPDVMVVCGEIQYEDEEQDMITNPTVIIEVLSPTMEAYDRGKKFENYRKVNSLQYYLLIAQDQYQVEKFSKDGEQWIYSAADHLEQPVSLETLQCPLLLSDLYDKVDLSTSHSSVRN